MTSYLFVIYPPKIWSWKAHAGYGRHSFNPMQKERDFIQHHLRKDYHGELLACPISISYDFYFEIPDSYSNKKKKEILNGDILHIKKTDVSNCVKLWEDALKGVIIEDDKYVVESIGRKHYSEKCKVVIKIEELKSREKNG